MDVEDYSLFIGSLRGLPCPKALIEERSYDLIISN